MLEGASEHAGLLRGQKNLYPKLGLYLRHFDIQRIVQGGKFTPAG